MKKFLFMLFSFIAVAGMTYGQDRVQDKDQTQRRDRIHQEDHLMLQDGTMYQIRQGTRTQLREQIKLNDGTVVNPDGSYQLQNQKKLQLRNGECLDMAGNRYLNQKQFNSRKMMTNKQIERARTKTMKRPAIKSRAGGRRGNQ